MPYFPTITTENEPGISINVTGEISYEQLLQSLASFNFRIISFYAYSNQLVQISESMNYNEFVVTGNRRIVFVNPSIDPYQDQRSLYKDVREMALTINGQSTLNFTMLPLATLRIIMYVDRIRVTDMMQSNIDDNFDTFENQEGLGRAFFDDFEEIIAT